MMRPGNGYRVAGLAIALLAAHGSAAHAQKAARVPVAARALQRGETLTTADIALVPVDSARGASRDPLPAARYPRSGWVTRRVIAAGEVLQEPAVAPPNVIASGQPVTLVYRDGGVQIRLRGVAANAAPAGGRVTVRVDPSRRSGQAGRNLEGVAEAPGVVRVR